MKSVCFFAICAVLVCPAFPQSGPAPAQDESNKQSGDKQPAEKPVNSSLKQPLAFGLEDGTPVRMRLTRNLSSADATTGDRVDFEVLDDVKIKDVVVIPRGGTALGTVTEAQHKRRMARGGKLNVNIDDVRLADGERVPLRAVKEVSGGGHTGGMVGGMVVTGIVFFPAAPFFLFMHGKDITIPKGTEITAYINGDTPLEPKRFAPEPTKPEGDASGQSPANPAEAKRLESFEQALSIVEIKSDPDGADITIDEKFMGSTPSTLRLQPGDHKIKLERSGFKPWEKTLTVSNGGSATISAVLESQ